VKTPKVNNKSLRLGSKSGGKTVSKNASEMLLVKLKEKGIPYAFWQAVIEVQEDAEEYATMHHDVSLKAKIEVLKAEERKIIGEEVHEALVTESIIKAMVQGEGSS
jgi:ribosomal protein S11